MSQPITAPIRGQHHSQGPLELIRFDLHALGEGASPFILLDDFRVRGRPFAPHPHAGFSAVTCVFEDSDSGLRVRDSLGNDVRVRPGGLVWTQAGQGVLHQEMASEPGQALHGAQIFINLSAAHKPRPAQTWWLDGPEVPEWRDAPDGHRVRVLVGDFAERRSPLRPAEPCTLLDLQLCAAAPLALPCAAGEYALLCVISGRVQVHAEADPAGHALASAQAASWCGPGTWRLRALTPRAQVLFMAAPRLCEPLVIHGPFIMNSRQQVLEAQARYESGQFGELAPLSQE